MSNAKNHIFMIRSIIAILASTTFSTILPIRKAITVAAEKERQQYIKKQNKIKCKANISFQEKVQEHLQL